MSTIYSNSDVSNDVLFRQEDKDYLILISISHLKALLFIIVVVVVVVLLLFIIYIVNLPVVRPRCCRVIFYFDTLALGRRHQLFGHIMLQQ
jgi:hypothetical protein